MEIKLKSRTEWALTLEIKHDDGKVEEKGFIGSRVGLSWPMAVNPGGYFVLVAQEARKLITGQLPLMVISEFKAQAMIDLFQRMFDVMGFFGCFEIFADLAPRFNSYIQSLDSYRKSNRNLQDVKLNPAPFAENFIRGHDSISRLTKPKVTKGLTIPRHLTIYSQLISMREDDLSGEPQNKWFAVNALRHVICAFETSTIPQSTKNRVPERGMPPGAWT